MEALITHAKKIVDDVKNVVFTPEFFSVVAATGIIAAVVFRKENNKSEIIQTTNLKNNDKKDKRIRPFKKKMTR